MEEKSGKYINNFRLDNKEFVIIFSTPPIFYQDILETPRIGQFKHENLFADAFKQVSQKSILSL